MSQERMLNRWRQMAQAYKLVTVPNFILCFNVLHDHLLLILMGILTISFPDIVFHHYNSRIRALLLGQLRMNEAQQAGFPGKHANIRWPDKSTTVIGLPIKETVSDLQALLVHALLQPLSFRKPIWTLLDIWVTTQRLNTWQLQKTLCKDTRCNDTNMRTPDQLGNTC